jgi:hypothetical protein
MSRSPLLAPLIAVALQACSPPGGTAQGPADASLPAPPPRTAQTSETPPPPPGPCGLRPTDWCPAPAGDPCGAHRDAASCKADARCVGMRYRGESVVACHWDARGFADNCPTVGCRSR